MKGGVDDILVCLYWIVSVVCVWIEFTETLWYKEHHARLALG